MIGGLGSGGDEMMMMKSGVTAVVVLETETSPHHGMRRIPFGDATVFDAVATAAAAVAAVDRDE